MMTDTDNTTTETSHPVSLTKRAILGAVVGFFLISLFLVSAGQPDPGWSKIWMLKPLIIVPIAGAMGGVFSFFMDPLHYQSNRMKLFAFLVSVIGYVVALWLGTVLGLDGTMWD